MRRLVLQESTSRLWKLWLWVSIMIYAWLHLGAFANCSKGFHSYQHTIQPSIPWFIATNLCLRSKEPNLGKGGAEAPLVQRESDWWWHGGLPYWHGSAPPEPWVANGLAILHDLFSIQLFSVFQHLASWVLIRIDDSFPPPYFVLSCLSKFWFGISLSFCSGSII